MTYCALVAYRYVMGHFTTDFACGMSIYRESEMILLWADRPAVSLCFRVLNDSNDDFFSLSYPNLAVIR